MQDENNDFSQKIQSPDNPEQPDFRQNQPPQQFQPYTQPMYPPVYAAPPSKSGKGFGIASLVLGAIGVVYSFFMFITSLVLMLDPDSVLSDIYDVGIDPLAAAKLGLVIMAVFGLIFAVLACVFALVARQKKCTAWIWIAGLITGILSFVMLFFTILFSVI